MSSLPIVLATMLSVGSPAPPGEKAIEQGFVSLFNGKKHVIGDPTELLRHVDDKGWNDYHIVVRGRRVTLMINGVTMCKLVDDDPRRTPAGHLALQTHKGPPMTVQFRNIRIRQ